MIGPTVHTGAMMVCSDLPQIFRECAGICCLYVLFFFILTSGWYTVRVLRPSTVLEKISDGLGVSAPLQDLDSALKVTVLKGCY